MLPFKGILGHLGSCPENHGPLRPVFCNTAWNSSFRSSCPADRHCSCGATKYSTRPQQVQATVMEAADFAVPPLRVIGREVERESLSARELGPNGSHVSTLPTRPRSTLPRSIFRRKTAANYGYKLQAGMYGTFYLLLHIYNYICTFAFTCRYMHMYAVYACGCGYVCVCVCVCVCVFAYMYMFICMFVYLSMCLYIVHMHVCMHACMFVSVCMPSYVCMYVCMYVRTYACMVCMHACRWMDGCRYVRLYVCMYVCMYVCIYVCTSYVYTCTDVYYVYPVCCLAPLDSSRSRILQYSCEDDISIGSEFSWNLASPKSLQRFREARRMDDIML